MRHLLPHFSKQACLLCTVSSLLQPTTNALQQYSLEPCKQVSLQCCSSRRAQVILALANRDYQHHQGCLLLLQAWTAPEQCVQQLHLHVTGAYLRDVQPRHVEEKKRREKKRKEKRRKEKKRKAKQSKAKKRKEKKRKEKKSKAKQRKEKKRREKKRGEKKSKAKQRKEKKRREKKRKEEKRKAKQRKEHAVGAYLLGWKADALWVRSMRSTLLPRITMVVVRSYFSGSLCCPMLKGFTVKRSCSTYNKSLASHDGSWA